MSSIRFVTFLQRIQNRVAPEYSFRKTSVNALNGMLDLVCEKLVDIMTSLKRQSGKQTTDAACVQTAVQLLFPTDFGKYAISFATTAVTKYFAHNTVSSSTSSVSNPSSVSAAPSSLAPVKNTELKVSRKSLSHKAGLTLPVSRVAVYLKRTSSRVSPAASIYLTAVLEFLAVEMLESAVEVTSAMGRKQISAEDLLRAVWGDRDWGFNHSATEKSKGKIQEKTTEQNSKKRSHPSFSGDRDMQSVATSVNWGPLKDAWKGMYKSSKRAKKEHVNATSGDTAVKMEPQVVVSA